MFTNKELLRLQIKTLQNGLPEKVLFRGQDILLTDIERMACDRAIWYIVQRGWGLGSAVDCASGSFNCSPSKIRRTVAQVFPDNYFIELNKQKNRIMYDKITDA